MLYPPSTPGGFAHVDLSALSGIAGSISIACWVVVFSPQIIENFRRRSADGLSVVFVITWLLGDVFNILGAVLQGVLPTMLILAVYYTLADIVLLGQVWYYRGFTWTDEVVESTSDEERRPLVGGSGSANGSGTVEGHLMPGSGSGGVRPRDGSFSSSIRRHLSVDGVHLSPATPFIDHAPKPADLPPAVGVGAPKRSVWRTVLVNTSAVLLVCAAGVVGWYISTHSAPHHHRYQQHSILTIHKTRPQPLHFDTWGQIFGYLCALLYLGSRIPQLLLNYRRKSTDGISLLFFLFACIGNLTYVLSIFAYDPTPLCTGAVAPTALKGIEVMAKHACAPGEAGQIYARYIAVNTSWILGSLGTLGLDMGIFVQFFMYRADDGDASDAESDL